MIHTTYTITATSKMAQAAADEINATLMASGFSTYFVNEPEFKNAIEGKINEELLSYDRYIKDNLKIVITENESDE
jgi:hypothetical protein